MQGLKAAGWTAVCGLGALSFLRIVACEIERANRKLARDESQAAKAYARRVNGETATEVPTGVVARSAAPRNGRNSDFIARSQS